MRTAIATYFRNCTESVLFLKETTLCDMFCLISNPFSSKIVRQMPPFKKSVQKIRTVLKLIHVAATCIKSEIRVVGKIAFNSERSAVTCLSVLFAALLPLEPPIEGDLQLQIMHETIRMGHFCDIMELFRMFCREDLLKFLSQSRVHISGVYFQPVALLLDRFDHDGVFNLFLSLLGSELVQPRGTWFSDRTNVIQVLLQKMTIVSREDSAEADRQAENAAHVLKKIVSSLDHDHLNLELLQQHKRLFSQTFGSLESSDDAVWNEKQFRYSIRVLSDWVLMTLGRFRQVDDKVFSECCATTISYLLVVKRILMDTSRSLVGFVRLELINYLVSLIYFFNCFFVHLFFLRLPSSMLGLLD